MFKNVASQKIIVFAFDETDNTPKTGDAVQITAKVSKDYGAASAITDTNPTEIEDGYYAFDLSQAETNADTLLFLPESSTADIQVIACPATVFTRPPYFTSLGIESDGDLVKVNALDGHTAQGGDNYARIGALGVGLTAVTDHTDLVTSARMGALTDWINGGRLDAILDIVAADVVNLDGEAMRGTNSAALATAVADVPTVAEFEARTVSTFAAGNLEDTYDGTGYSDDSAPAKQSQLANIANVGSAINTTAESFTKAGAEPETLTYEATAQLDDTYHEVEDAGGTTDVYYEADVGANGVPSSVTWHGYAQGQGDSYLVRAYNFGTTTWEQVGSITGTSGTTKITESWDLTTAHVSSANKVRLGLYSTDGSKIATDRILFSYSVVARSVGYSMGAIWVNSAGNAGTEDYVNGTADNPCPWANALTISASMGIKKFSIANGNTITLTAAAENYTFVGYEWNMDLSGESIAGSYFEYGNIYGIGTGTNYRFIRCKIALASAISLESGGMKECVFGSAGITLSAAGTYMMAECIVANDSAYIDFEDAAENKNLYMPNFSGDIEFRNFGHATGVHKIMLTGQGHIMLNANCESATGADVFDIHGMFHVADSVSGGWGGTLEEEARVDISAINAEVVDALATDTYAEPGQGAPGATISLAAKINFLYKLLRNKVTNDGTDIKVYNDAGAVVDQKAAVSESGGTVTRDEFGTGA